MRVIFLESKDVNYHPIIHQLHLVCLILGQVARIYERVIQNRKFIGLKSCSQQPGCREQFRRNSTELVLIA